MSKDFSTPNSEESIISVIPRNRGVLYSVLKIFLFSAIKQDGQLWSLTVYNKWHVQEQTKMPRLPNSSVTVKYSYSNIDMLTAIGEDSKELHYTGCTTKRFNTLNSIFSSSIKIWEMIKELRKGKVNLNFDILSFIKWWTKKFTFRKWQMWKNSLELKLC